MKCFVSAAALASARWIHSCKGLGRTVCYEATKVATNNAVPRRALTLIKLVFISTPIVPIVRISMLTNGSLDVLSNILQVQVSRRAPTASFATPTLSTVNFAIASWAAFMLMDRLYCLADGR